MFRTEGNGSFVGYPVGNDFLIRGENFVIIDAIYFLEKRNMGKKRVKMEQSRTTSQKNTVDISPDQRVSYKSDFQ